MHNYLCLVRCSVFAGLFLSGWALAGGVKPTQEFWDYMMEYSDDQGEILDPLEYEQIHNLKEERNSVVEMPDQNSEFSDPKKSREHQTTSIKVTSSSAQSSRANEKGVAQ